MNDINFFRWWVKLLLYIVDLRVLWRVVVKSLEGLLACLLVGGGR